MANKLPDVNHPQGEERKPEQGFFFKFDKKKRLKNKKKLYLLKHTKSNRIDSTKIIQFYQKLFSTDIFKRKFTLLILAKNEFVGLDLITGHKRGPLKCKSRTFLISKVRHGGT